jgi:hypothetical protein
VIPDTGAALLALLGLIAPGLVFQSRRERRRPLVNESAFREASRVALSSVIFSTTSLVIMLYFARTSGSLPNIADWLADPKGYLAANYQKVGLFLLSEATLACALAWLAESATGSAVAPHIAPVSIWYAAFRRDVPRNTHRIWVWITTENGVQFKGPLRSYTPGDGSDVREIALGGSPIRRLPHGADETTGWTTLDGFDLVVVTTDDIRHFAVSYLDAAGNTLMASPWQSRSQRMTIAAKNLPTHLTARLRSIRAGRTSAPVEPSSIDA